MSFDRSNAAPQSGDRIYVVAEGMIMVSQTLNSGKQVVVDICQPQEIFGESALVNRFSRCGQAVALEPAKVMSWTAAELVERATCQSRLGLALLQLLAQRESDLAWHLGSLAVDPIYLRVARSLIRLCGRIGTRQEDGSVRMAPLTHRMLSQYIRSSPRPMGELAAGIPDQVEAIVNRCLEALVGST